MNPSNPPPPARARGVGYMVGPRRCSFVCVHNPCQSHSLNDIFTVFIINIQLFPCMHIAHNFISQVPVYIFILKHGHCY